MKRSVLIDADLSDYTQAEFFNFLFFLITQKAKFKKFGVLFKYTQTSRKAYNSYVLYTLLATGFSAMFRFNQYFKAL